MFPSTCPSEDELQAFNTGLLDRLDRLDQLAEHLEICPSCLHKLRSYPADTLFDAETGSRDLDEQPYWHEAEFLEALSRIVDISAVDRLGRSDSSGSTPTRIGDYQISEQLGEGGMGTIFKAWHPRLQRAVVLKMIRLHSVRDPVAVDQFRREMAVLGNLDHPVIVKAYDAAEEAGREYLVMEYVPGSNLRDLVRDQGTLSVADGCAVGHEVALGLQYLHERGLVHRDIKPSNLALSPDRRVRVLDLGLAIPGVQADTLAATSSAELSRFANNTQRIEPVSWQGTVDYMAPEQSYASQEVTGAADLYSLGATLYTLFAGAPPLVTYRTVEEKIAALRSEPLRPIGELRPDLPKPVAALVMRLLAKEPADRPASARAVAEQLRPWAKSATVVQLTNERPTKLRPRPTGWAVSSGLLVVSLLVTAIVWNDLAPLRPLFTPAGHPSATPLPSRSKDHSPAPNAAVPHTPVPDLPADATSPGSRGAAAIPERPLPPRPRYSPWRVGAAEQRLAGLALFPPTFTAFQKWQVETIRPRGVVRAMAVSPDGRHLAHVGDDENVRVFERRENRFEISAILPRKSQGYLGARFLAWSPDGRLLASATSAEGDPVEVWDWRRSERVFDLRGHTAGVVGLEWNRDGSWLASACRQGRARIWNRTGLLEHELNLATHELTCLTWHPQRSELLLGTHDGSLVWWNPTNRESRRFSTGQSSPWLAIAWRPQGGEWVAVAADHHLRRFTWPAGAAVESLAPDQSVLIPSPFRSMMWTPDGQAVCIVANSLLRWNYGDPSMAIVGSRDCEFDPWVVGGCAPNAEKYLMVSAGGRIREVPFAPGQPRDWRHESRVYIRNLAWNRESTRIAVCSVDGQLQIWGGQGRPYGVLPIAAPNPPHLRCAAWSPSGLQVAAAELSAEGRIHVWEVDSRREIGSWTHGANVDELAWSEDQELLVSVGRDRRARIGQVRSAKEIASYDQHGEAVTCIQSSPHTRRFATGDWGRQIHVWEVLPDASIRSLARWTDQPEPIWSLAWSPNGDKLLVSGVERRIWLLDATTGKIEWSREGTGAAGRVSWKNDGLRVYGNGLGILDAATGESLTPLAAYPEPANYSPDGRWVLEVSHPQVVTSHHASNQFTNWRAVPLDVDSSATFAPTGQVVYQTDPLADHLRYVIQTSSNQFQTLHPLEFEQRLNRRISKQ